MNRSRLNMTTSHVTRTLFTLPVPKELIYPGQVGLVSGGAVVTVSLIGSTLITDYFHAEAQTVAVVLLLLLSQLSYTGCPLSPAVL